MNNQLLIGILGGMVIWSITSIIGFSLRRYRLRRALLEDLRHRISNLAEVHSGLESYFERCIKEGSRIERYFRYTKDRFAFYEDIRHELYNYFGARKLIVLMRSYEALEEIEILMAGLSQDFQDYRSNRKMLTGSDVMFLESKKDRIYGVMKVLKEKPVHALADLPANYQGMPSAVQVFGKIRRVS